MLEVSNMNEVLSPRKRKRDDSLYGDMNISWADLDDDESIPPLPSETILETVVETYFSKIQPWIPFLHMPSFRTRLRDPRERPKIKLLLHAIISATMKHLSLADLEIDREEMRRLVRVSRNVVTLHAMSGLSIENVQALIVLAFDYVCKPSLRNSKLTLELDGRWTHLKSVANHWISFQNS